MMKKRMMVIVLLAGTLIGCSKIEKNAPIENEAQQGVPIVTNLLKTARNNPYDSSGIRHNELLEVLRNYQRKTGDTTRSGRQRTLLEAVKFRGDYTAIIDFEKVDALYKLIQETGLSDFLDKTYLNDRFKEYLLRLEAIAKDVRIPDLFYSFLIRISELEQEILKEDRSVVDVASLLRISSIVYHSGLYWKKVYNNNDWIISTTEPAELRWWQFPIVLNADFIGGLAGFLLGGSRDEIETASGWMSGGAEGFLGS